MLQTDLVTGVSEDDQTNGLKGTIMPATQAGRMWITERVRTYKCKYCKERYDRAKPYCPSCKTRKGTKGLGAPDGSMPF